MPSKLPCAQWFTRHQRGERNICVLIITCMSRYVRNANIEPAPNQEEHENMSENIGPKISNGMRA